ncbi:hypothetical protein F5Y05DRAFT_424880 [Hypoxylon sp. FL0543]|nr:hypothetical protein F5Y05DRAFT_424880 [Hypoxylon sp. FL0543]
MAESNREHPVPLPGDGWEDDDIINLLTSIPGFDFSEVEAPRRRKLAGVKEILLLDPNNNAKYAPSQVIYGVSELFGHATAFAKKNQVDDAYWWTMWQESRWAKSPPHALFHAAPESMKSAIEFYVAGYKKGRQKAGKRVLEQSDDASTKPLLKEAIASIEEWIWITEGIVVSTPTKPARRGNENNSDEKANDPSSSSEDGEPRASRVGSSPCPPVQPPNTPDVSANRNRLSLSATQAALQSAIAERDVALSEVQRLRQQLATYRQEMGEQQTAHDSITDILRTQVERLRAQLLQFT